MATTKVYKAARIPTGDPKWTVETFGNHVMNRRTGVLADRLDKGVYLVHDDAGDLRYLLPRDLSCENRSHVVATILALSAPSHITHTPTTKRPTTDRSHERAATSMHWRRGR